MVIAADRALLAGLEEQPDPQEERAAEDEDAAAREREALAALEEAAVRPAKRKR